MFASGSPSWQNPRVLLTLLLVFLAGASTGALAVRTSYRHTSAAGYGNLSYERLKNDLNLSPPQAEKIKIILNDLYRFNEDLKAQVEDTRATGKNRIRAVLTPEQRKHFEKICTEVQYR